MSTFDSDKIWRCECSDGHFLSISGFDETTRPDGEVIEALRWFSVDGSFRAPNRRSRLVQLWKMLRHGATESWVGVQLDRKTTTEIRDELTRLLELMEHETGGAP
jgi:hypothetical protein